MTGVKTHHDRLWNLGESILEQRVQIFGFGKGRGPRRGFGCCQIIALYSFIGSAHEVSKHFFLRSRPPFQVFTLESHFFIFFLFYFFLFHFSIVLLCTWQFKIHPEQVDDLLRSLAEEKETTTLLIMKIFSRKNLFRPNIHVQSKWAFQVRNVGQGLWFWKKG